MTTQQIGDVVVRDRYADRQAGVASPPLKPARRRARTPAPTAELPAQTDGRYFVTLVRGLHYHLVSADLSFEPGMVVEVSAEVHAHLADAIDVVSTYKDPQLGRVVRRARKFRASPEYPPVEDHYPDLAE